MNTTQMSDVIEQLDLGNSVAEFDEALEKYFVETEPFKALAEGKVDLVAGDKGTGKTAIFRVIRQRYKSIPEMGGIEIVAGFNMSGNPVFQRLTQEPVLSEGQYRSLWKAYILSLVGNWLLEIFDPNETTLIASLDELLRNTKLRSDDNAPATVFSRIVNAVRKTFVKSVGAEFTFSESGIPIVTPKVEFGKAADSSQKTIPHEEALRLLNRCLQEVDVTVWVALDRLDEAFQGFPAVETPALRALLRTYLDLLEFDRVRLKLFVRRDLFRKVVKGGFVNLTHVNARKIEIVWDEDDLLNLFCQRLRESGSFLSVLGVQDGSNVEIFDSVFPGQIDVGERKPTSWNWIMARIRDGNQIKPPRNLIDLVAKAREAQLRREERESRVFHQGLSIIEADSIRRALKRLSADRVEDTLLAEAGESADPIERFRGGKSEHNLHSLGELLGVPTEEVQSIIKPLIELGFLEPIGENYKIPMLYRDGLDIVQGKAF